MQTGMQGPEDVDEEFEEEMRVKKAQMERVRRKSIGKPADHEAWLAKVAADKAAAEAAEKAKKEAEAQEWEKAKNMLASRAEVASGSNGDAGKTVLQAIEALATKAVEAEEHAERCDRLSKVLGQEQIIGMRQRARRKSKELQDEIASMMEGKVKVAS
jgi:response regulator RpfG family c-di-GMP phosphodiesterase